MSKTDKTEGTGTKAKAKVVRIYSLDKKYRMTPYPAVAAEDTQYDTFVTGQQFAPGLKQGQYLTKDEMFGKTPLTGAKQIRFPYVIDPNARINVVHGAAFDLSLDDEGNPVNPKDFAVFNFIKLQDFVAPTKADYRKGKHYFYIDDREAAAEKNVTKFQVEFAAQELVYRNTARRRLLELAMLMGYYIKGFKAEFKGFTDSMILEKLLLAARENPSEVLRCDTEEAKNDLFVLKLADKQIIQRKMDGFFDGGRFLGTTPSEVYVTMNRKENEMLLSRCTQALLKDEEEEE